jgi:hypothetical protein
MESTSGDHSKWRNNFWWSSWSSLPMRVVTRYAVKGASERGGGLRRVISGWGAP